MKTKLVTIFLCITTILTGCTGQENKNHQDGQEIATLDFNDIIQDMDIQNSESEENTPDLKNQANVISSGTSENDGSTESAAGTEASAGQSQEVSDSSQKNKTAQDLYTGFIKNEVPVIIAEDYPQNDYKTYNLEPNKSYTFTQLGEFVNTSYYDPEYSTKTSYDDVQYAYLDCANSDAKNLLVKFSGLGIYAPDDDSFAVYVITENNGQLYLTDSYECWARSGMRAYKNGLFVSDGSGGAGEHYAGVSALMPDGKITDIYEA
ncbi:MAG: hypothetical protein K2N73_16935, partial [Lachnospiraceae bacterium]|nr:hypothetical protein [Lachnospiraceae bacterium]